MPVYQQAAQRVAEMLVPTLRLGVTGLARSGKTIFITALVRNLINGGHLPFFHPYAEGRILRAYLEPQPDDSVPRFDYEAHVAKLSADPPRWPESTRRISQLRLTIEYTPASLWRRMLGLSRLHVDIVDYPGEWLIDLPLVDMDYTAWAESALTAARDPRRAAAAKPFLTFLEGISADAPQDEQIAATGARLFTDYLRAVRSSESPITLGPGRFLMPGDLEGSPLLTFFPLETTGAAVARGSLAAMMSRRFTSYKSHVVTPFFRDHFSRLDRQIVLVDVLGALNAGPEAVSDLEQALADVLRVFRPGAPTWLSAILGRRIDRLVFAATKADHLPSSSHDRLEAVLRLITQRANVRAQTAGADTEILAIAALRATREAEARDGKDRIPCIVGVPMAGEQINGTMFDGTREAAIFPGDLPADAGRALDVTAPASNPSRFVRFRPPRLAPPGPGGETPSAPHIRLDRALDYLIGDYLA
jgi:predicted YcjX-like family ATPase